MRPATSYHDVYITLPGAPRRRLFDMPYGYELSCTRTSGWELWYMTPYRQPTRVGSEYPATRDKQMRVDVGGVVVCDSLRSYHAHTKSELAITAPLVDLYGGAEALLYAYFLVKEGKGRIPEGHEVAVLDRMVLICTGNIDAKL